MSLPDLEPCLRCGAEAVWEKKSGDLGYTNPAVRICCSAAAQEHGAKQLDGCFIRTPWISLPHFGDARGHRKAQNSLAKAWNQRDPERVEFLPVPLIPEEIQALQDEAMKNLQGALGFPQPDTFDALKSAVADRLTHEHAHRQPLDGVAGEAE